MKIAMIGAGGVGGYFGARLAEAGHDVHFIARGKHLAAMQTDGLRISSVAGDLHLQPTQATDDPTSIGPVDVVMLGVKSWQVESTLPQIKPLLGADTWILPLQNGVGTPDILLREFAPERVTGGLCRIISYIAGPGHIQHDAASPTIEFGELDNQQSERVLAFADVLNACVGVTGKVPSDIQVAMWVKFALISPLSTLGSTTRAPIDLIYAEPETRVLLETVIRELIAVGKARGVALADDTLDRTLAFIAQFPPGITASMQRDMMANRPSELMGQTGAVVAMAAELGVPVPVTQTLYRALLLQEQRARGQVAFDL